MILYYIGILLFAALLVVLIKRAISIQKRIKHALRYGRTTFDVDLPEELSNKTLVEIKKIESLNNCSQEEFFFMFVTPQVGRLPKDKRKLLKEAADQLNAEIKMKKSIYQAFTTEHEIYDGLTDKQATEKWLERGEEK